MNNKGQNLIEFLLILALVVIVCIFAISTLGHSVFAQYSNSSVKVKGFQPFGKPYQTETSLKTDTSNVTNPDPQEQIADATPSIDLGPYILTGIPSDLNDFIETQGTSGGSDLFAGLFEQIADQLKENGDSDGYSEFKQLAELTRMMADMQKQDEQAAKTCQETTGNLSGSDAHSCFQTYYNSNQAPQLRDTLNDVLTSYNTDAENHDIMVYNDLGLARHSKITDTAQYESLKTTYPSFGLIDTYDSIMSNSKYSDELKSITTKIYQNLSDITTNHSVYSGNYGFGIWDLPTINYDPITGENRTAIDFGWDTFNTEGLSEIINPSTSSELNLAAALLCTSSNNYLNGNDCN